MSLNLALVLFWGLFIAVLGYPFLHELGHGMVAILMGASVEEFCLFTVAYVSCNVHRIGEFGQVLIGVSGMLFPFICGITIHCKILWLLYVVLVLNIISIIALLYLLLVVFCLKKILFKMMILPKFLI